MLAVTNRSYSTTARNFDRYQLVHPSWLWYRLSSLLPGGLANFFLPVNADAIITLGLGGESRLWGLGRLRDGTVAGCGGVF